MYFVALCLIYILFFLDMSFKLTILKTKCFQKIVENRKIKCFPFGSMFLRGLFYRLKLIFQISDNIGYALVGVTSLLLLVVKINQWRKLRKVISFTYTLQPGIEGVLIIFLRWEWVWKNSLKIISGSEGLQ